MIIFQSCGKIVKVDEVPMKWSNFDLDLPDGIEIYEGTNDQIPLKAWVAKVDALVSGPAGVDSNGAPASILHSLRLIAYGAKTDFLCC